MDIRTETVHFTADQKLLDFVDMKIGKLEQYYDRIMDANVYLQLENGGQVKDKIVEVRLNVPGDSIFIKETSKTFETAVDGAADRLKRQLIKHKEMVRGR